MSDLAIHLFPGKWQRVASVNEVISPFLPGFG
jgi:hypothetical protein